MNAPIPPVMAKQRHSARPRGRAPVCRRLLTVALVSAALGATACMPSLRGGWDASGHLDVARAFDLDLSFQSATEGLAVYATTASGERTVPVCRLTRTERQVSFVIDTEAQTTCETLVRPLRFDGVLGQDVIAGKVFGADGQPIGIWRAFRRPTPSH